MSEETTATEAMPIVAPAESQEINWETIGKKQDQLQLCRARQDVGAYEKTLTSIAKTRYWMARWLKSLSKMWLVNINYKSEGVVPLSEFRYNPDLKIGDKVEVYVEKQEDKNGTLLISHKKARFVRAWERVNERPCYQRNY